MIFREQKDLYYRRFFIIIAVILFCVAIIFFRAIQLTCIERNFLLKQGLARTVRMHTVTALRGGIFDRFHTPLAMSVPVADIWIDPRKFDLYADETTLFLHYLHLSEATLAKQIQSHSKKSFLYIKRMVPLEIAKKIEAIHQAGVYVHYTYKRSYPFREILAPVLGFVNIDHKGQEGLELLYNKRLTAHEGRMLVEQDRYGHVVSILKLLSKSHAGKSLVLSIDNHAQYQAYKALENTVKQSAAASASMVVLYAKTGEVLVMANYPSYDPENRDQKRSDNYKNRVLTDLFEPGSTFKTFALAAALLSGKYQVNDMVDTAPGWLLLNKKIVRDEGQNFGRISLTEVLVHSSNVGISRVILTIPKADFFHLLRDLGFGEPTDLFFPGEMRGSLRPERMYDDFGVATLSFGYGVSVNLLQLAAAYMVIANDGLQLPVRLIKAEDKDVITGKRRLPVKTAKAIREVLTEVVQSGTGRFAAVSGYKVAGKTGTARIAGPNGYEKDHHNAMFVGMVPAEHPKFVAAIIVRDPQEGSYYAARLAAPIFAAVMPYLLNSYR